MASLKEEAQAYEGGMTLNITDLPKVSVDIELVEETHTDKQDKEFTIKVAMIDKEKYRVPASVLKQLKAILEEKPNLKFFKVKKSGTGLNTDYTVIPLD